MGQTNTYFLDCFSAASPCPGKQPEHISLRIFASEFGVFLDSSRGEFCDRMDEILRNLMANKLKHRNRFRELLLGVKAVGKSYLLKAVHDYVTLYYPAVLVIRESFDACDSDRQIGSTQVGPSKFEAF